MANSLQDQLRKSGLIDAKKARQAAKERHGENKARRHGQRPTADNQTQTLAQAAQAEKNANDRRLNQEKNDRAQRKGLAAQIKQLINMNTIAAAGDQAFNFTDGKHIKRMYVDKAQAERLSAGVLAIAKQGNKYVLVPSTVADKIVERDQSSVIFRAEKIHSSVAEDDPYADYQVPDDLMW